MDYRLWIHRLKRVAVKTAWSAWSTVVAKPRVELVHQRDIPGEPREYEFVRRCVGSAYIEPLYGYVIGGNGYLLGDSLLTNYPFTKPPWRNGLTSPWQFMKARHDGGVHFERHRSVISLRHFWEWNYFHFFVDVLGKLRLFDESGIDPSTPIVLGYYAVELPFVQQVIGLGQLKQRNWIIQGNTCVLADEVFYGRTRQGYRHKLDYVMDLMGVPKPPDSFNDRIFLTRKKGGSRSVTNLDQVEAVLQEYGFRIVDTAGLSIAEQIDLFSKARYLLGVHGAGMTNIMFRRGAPLSVLEFHPATYVTDDFLIMCREWGYRFDRLACNPVGSSIPQHASIHIDPAQLRQKIEQMLKNEEPCFAD